MSQEKVKILEASYDTDKSLAKIKVRKIETNEEVTWALTAESFDSFIAQITGKSLEYYDLQRLTLCEHIVGVEFINSIKVDIDNADVSKAKEKPVTELRHHHDTIDRYPFYELQQEAIEEATNGKPEDKD